MNAVLWLFFAQGLLGAFDTVYYHEVRARLPAGGVRARPELLLHAARDLVYAVLFATLPFFDWRGALAFVLAVLIVAEIALTMADFVVEVRVRDPIGVLPGERVTHGLMAIVYGAALACLAPELLAWSREPTALAAAARDVSGALRWILLAMGAGVFLSGVRDAAAALGLPGSSYPWSRPS